MESRGTIDMKNHHNFFEKKIILPERTNVTLTNFTKYKYLSPNTLTLINGMVAGIDPHVEFWIPILN